MKQVHQYNLNISDIDISEQQIIKGMGYIDQDPPDYLLPLIRKFLDESDKHINLKAGFKLFDSNINIESKKITIAEVDLTPRKIITRHLKGASKLVIFAASAGIEFDQWIRSFYNSNDQLNGYIVDTIGSEIVESTGDWLESKLESIASPETCSNRLSPGYCEWSVADQHKLFSLLPDNFCGISLSPSALMTPIKSISGIIGVGQSIRRLDYQCNICDLENCYKRIREIRQSEN